MVFSTKVLTTLYKIHQSGMAYNGHIADFSFNNMVAEEVSPNQWKTVFVGLHKMTRHECNLPHAFMKPANIFVTGEGRLKIGDFGMASIWPRPVEPVATGTPNVNASGTSGFEREGDKLYLAPEVLQGKYSKAADIFRCVLLLTPSSVCY